MYTNNQTIASVKTAIYHEYGRILYKLLYYVAYLLEMQRVNLYSFVWWLKLQDWYLSQQTFEVSRIAYVHVNKPSIKYNGTVSLVLVQSKRRVSNQSFTQTQL